MMYRVLKRVAVVAGMTAAAPSIAAVPLSQDQLDRVTAGETSMKGGTYVFGLFTGQASVVASATGTTTSVQTTLSVKPGSITATSVSTASTTPTP